MSLHTIDFNEDWLFYPDIQPVFKEPDFDDSNWKKVSLPHDWCVEGKFSPDASGFARNAWLEQGVGCYRKHFSFSRNNRNISPVLHFGGIAGISEIFINGEKIGGEEWAFVPLELDLSSHWNDNGTNVIVVMVDQSHTPVCRWYEGAGIYRDVQLEFHSQQVKVPTNGIYIQTLSAENDNALIAVEYHLQNLLKKRISIELLQRVKAPDGTVLFEDIQPHTLPAGMQVFMNRKYTINSPELWSIETPGLYSFETEIIYNGEKTDFQKISFGIRTFRFDAEKGFFLNGHSVKLNGVCLHNDLGALGVACTEKGIQRQLEIMKSMGCNAVRTSHNPFGENFLNLCDKLGILVLAEIFDEWQEPQRVAPISDGEFQSMYVRYYHHLFDKRAENDLRRIIARDRNHPSIILWSIGNEVKQMYKFSGKEIAGRLQEQIHNMDPTRPVTCAVVVDKVCHENIDILDVAGYNYPSPEQMDQFHSQHPDQPMVITECFSAQTRRPLGEYYPSEQLPKLDYHWPDAENYISWLEHFQQGLTAWKAADKREFVSGSFIWTGMDYLGEPTPYDFPAHSSFFGVVDLCGFPKDGYYFYKSVWKKEEPLVHIATSWDFKSQDKIDVHIITNCPHGQLFLNDKPVASWNGNNRIIRALVNYEPGELKAVGISDSGKTVNASVFTSGEPATIRLTPYFNSKLHADGKDMEFIACEILDSNGHLCRNTTIPITFHVAGGTIQALDNGLQTSLEPFQGTNTRFTCAGRCLAIVKTMQHAGTLTLTASSDGLKAASCSLIVSDALPQ